VCVCGKLLSLNCESNPLTLFVEPKETNEQWCERGCERGYEQGCELRDVLLR
jgi:hypothetical protein